MDLQHKRPVMQSFYGFSVASLDKHFEENIQVAGEMRPLMLMWHHSMSSVQRQEIHLFTESKSSMCFQFIPPELLPLLTYPVAMTSMVSMYMQMNH